MEPKSRCCSVLGGLAIAAGLAACGGSGSQLLPSASGSAIATPAPPPPHYVIVTRALDTGTLYFVRDDGVLLGSHSFGGDVSGLTAYVASTSAAGRFWYIARSDGHLHSITPNGADADVAELPDVVGSSSPGGEGLAVSPDGTQWAWGVLLGSGPTGPWQTRVDLGGVGRTARHALEEPTSNYVLSPVGWTSGGVLVSRNATGVGGCCYLTPEYGARDAMLLDPTTLQATSTWPGCATAAVSGAGSFACAGPVRTGRILVHKAGGGDITVTAVPPSVWVGWAIVDDSANRVIFGVIHDLGEGSGRGPYIIDTEAGDLTTLGVTKLFDQTTPDAALPGVAVVVTAAPAAVDLANSTVALRSASQGSKQLGPKGVAFAGILQLPS